jgi:hypothetical protein
MAHVSDDRQSFSNLEVAPTSEPEVWKYKTPECSGLIALVPHSFSEALPGQGPAFTSYVDPASHATASDTEKEFVSSPGKRRRLVILCAILGIIAIVGAVTGGVLGSRHSEHTAENNEGPQPTQEVLQQEVLSDSRLSAVNWTSGDAAGVHYRAVFWQAATHDSMASIWESDTRT